MIPANELRIGNSIYDRHGNITHIHNGWFYIVQDIKRLEDYSPIPLTPEILDKCGFAPNKGWYIGSIKLIRSGGRCLASSEDNEGGFNYLDATELHYLHQLQNLYFALTGEELNFKP